MQPATPNDPLVALAVTPAPGPRVLRLTGTPLLLARLTWAALAGTALTLLVVALPEAFGAHVRGTLGLFPLLSGAVTAAAYLLIGVLVAWRAPRELMALVFSGMLVAVGATTFVPPPAGVATDLLTFAGYALLIVSFFLFPTGRLEPRGSWPLMAFYVLQELLHNFAPHSPLSSHTWPGATGNVVWLSTFIVGFGAQAYRYRRASGPRERQQSRWVLFGFGVLVAGALLFAVLPELIAPGLVDLGKALFALSALALPTSVAVAVTRHRLWDLAPLVNRALLLALLSGLLAAVYVAVVAAAEQLVGRTQPSVNAVGAVAVALAFGPLRARLQTLANRLTYGERDDPYAVLARVSERVQGSVSPEEVLEPLVRTVRDALRLPFVVLELDGPARQVVIGTPSGAEDVRPLVFQHEELGRLRLGRRDPDEAFGAADERLIVDLSRQLGSVAHAARLTRALQESRERLVNALEDERRRLRRDLHDGLGPQLAALTLQAGALRHLIARDPDAAVRQVAELQGELRGAIADIRRLVYGLRPPTLDEFGLSGAIREHAARVAVPQGPQPALAVRVVAPDVLPPLPAAVEVAAYRIVQEALTNVVRHADARRVEVELRLDGALRLRVSDDGRGIDPEARFGVGLLSMRERARELGGSCETTSGPEGGTTVHVTLPLTGE